MPTAEELSTYYSGLSNPTTSTDSYNNLTNIMNVQLSIIGTKQQRLADRTTAKQNKLQTATQLQQGLSDVVDAQQYHIQADTSSLFTNPTISEPFLNDSQYTHGYPLLNSTTYY